MKMNINFQVTGNDRKKVATYTILFPQFQKHKISLIMMSWFYLQSSLKRVKKEQQNQWYSCFEKKILVSYIA